MWRCWKIQRLAKNALDACSKHQYDAIQRQFLFAAKIASEQSWSSIAGHWTCTTGWQANFDNMLSRKGGRPLVKWDDVPQPEEQHGFRKGHGIEEHLLTANLVVDKLLAVSTPIWIVSLDLSKAFDRLSWDKLWVALQAHGVSDHLVWTMQNLYMGQLGQIQGDIGDGRVFAITAGVRQGCVLSPRLFTATLQWAMQNGGKGWKILLVVLIWKMVVQNYWISDSQMTYYCLPVPNLKQFFVGNFDGKTCICGIVSQCR